MNSLWCHFYQILMNHFQRFFSSSYFFIIFIHLFYYTNYSNIFLFFFFQFSFFSLSSQCVDEWLRVNASCPTCRKSILPPTQTNNSDSTTLINTNNTNNNNNNNIINVTQGDRPGMRLITVNFDITNNPTGWMKCTYKVPKKEKL